MRLAFPCLALLLVTTTGALAQESQEQSATAVVCTQIVDNSCEGASSHFSAAVGKLFGFSQVVDVPDRLIHVWFYGDKELGRIAMHAAKANRWRCWSNVTVNKSMTGKWRLEARTPDGKVLASFSFTVQ